MSIALTTTDIPKEPAKRRVWVIAMLRLKGSSLRRIATAQKVSQQAVSNALLSPSRFLEEAIADELDVPVNILFRERFDDCGNRITQVRERQRITASHPDNGKGREVA